jgi:hypothetical protein
LVRPNQHIDARDMAMPKTERRGGLGNFLQIGAAHGNVDILCEASGVGLDFLYV